MQNCNFQSRQQEKNLPLDPDSRIPTHAEPVQNTPYASFVQTTSMEENVAVSSARSSENGGIPERPLCNPNGLCLPQPYPAAKANAENERYACIIRNGFAGRESVLTAMMTYLYQSIYFGACDDDLREMLAAIALCKMFHLRLLGELLMSLGSNPKYFCCMPPNVSCGTWWAAQPVNVAYSKILSDALNADIELEKASIDEHKNTINYVDDEGIRTLLKRIVMDEKYHLKMLTELHKRFCS
ncbi:MAG: hypothetical protein ACK5L0_03995 [Candidatus Fimivivens sp.]